MELQTLLTADYLDIVYDNRNKNYGGYELRKHYNRRMGRAFIYLLSIIAAFACLSFISVKGRNGQEKAFDKKNVITDVLLPPQPPRAEPPLPPSPPLPAQHIKTNLFTDPVITDDVVPDDKLMASAKDLSHSIVGPTTSDGDTADISIAPPSTSKPHTTGVVADMPDAPRRMVEQMPFFAGDLGAYISSHLHYPEAARGAGIEGRVVIEFVVNEDGTVSNVRVGRGIGGGCDEEALAMVRGMPKWKPGKQNGVPVKVYFTLPVKFELQ